MITDYASLQQKVAEWTARADLGTMIPTCIQLAEARINRELRTRQMMVQVEGTVDDDLQLPANALQIASFRVKRGGCWVELPPMPQSAVADMCNSTFPWGYVVGPDDTQDQTGTEYQLAYYEALPSLTDAAPQNWLIIREPGIYLYATLIELAPAIKAPAEELIVWSQQFRSILDGMQKEDDYARYGVAPRQMSPLRNAP